MGSTRFSALGHACFSPSVWVAFGAMVGLIFLVRYSMKVLNLLKLAFTTLDCTTKTDRAPILSPILACIDIPVKALTWANSEPPPYETLPLLRLICTMAAFLTWMQYLIIMVWVVVTDYTVPRKATLQSNPSQTH